MTWVAAGSLIGAGGALGSSAMGANATANSAKQARATAREQMEQQQKQFEERQSAYNGMVGRGGDQMKEGETQFLGENAKPLGELDQIKQDILNKNAAALQQGSGQMSADLAAGGVRGGQAATLMNRGTGEMAVNSQENLNQNVLNDAITRRQNKSNFFGAKSAAGQHANLSAPTF
jgi:Flp pilus assembly CpaE family ATPase